MDSMATSPTQHPGLFLKDVGNGNSIHEDTVLDGQHTIMSTPSQTVKDGERYAKH